LKSVELMKRDKNNVKTSDKHVYYNLLAVIQSSSIKFKGPHSATVEVKSRSRRSSAKILFGFYSSSTGEIAFGEAVDPAKNYIEESFNTQQVVFNQLNLHATHRYLLPISQHMLNLFITNYLIRETLASNLNLIRNKVPNMSTTDVPTYI
jgi:hypothetical protein